MGEIVWCGVVEEFLFINNGEEVVKLIYFNDDFMFVKFWFYWYKKGDSIILV